MAVQERQEHAGFQVKPKHHEHGHGKEERAQLMWINHFALLPGDDSLKTSFNAVNSGVGGGLTGLVITSTTTGDIAANGGNKVVHMAVEVPPGYVVHGVRVGYELTSSSSFISQIRLAQVQDPPNTAIVLLDGSAQYGDRPARRRHRPHRHRAGGRRQRLHLDRRGRGAAAAQLAHELRGHVRPHRDPRARTAPGGGVDRDGGRAAVAGPPTGR